MKILIANDDGIFAPGIAALVHAFAAAGHEAYVCAPDSQRSAASHALSIARAIDVKEIAFPGAARAFAIGGTPVDCVKLGLLRLCPEAEFVVSGINKGYNAGSDVLYSGTVGAAMEGVLLGRPAMAVSIAAEREDNYEAAAQLAVHCFDRLQEKPLPSGMLLNLNHPACDCARGIKAVPLKHLVYDETYALSEGEDGAVRYALSGKVSEKLPMGEDDYSYLLGGYATVTAIGYDITQHEATASLEGLF